jgi:hypothetical protein
MSKNIVKKSVVNRSENTILTNPLTYDIKNLIFDSAVKSTIPNTTIGYYRINIATKNPDGKEGELVLGFDRCNSSGVSEVRDQASGKLTGYSLALTLTNRDGTATDKQTATLKLIDNIIEKAKEYLMNDEVQEEVERYFKPHEFENMSPVWYKKEKGKIVEGAVPMIFCKLLYSKEKVDKQGKSIPARIVTDFWLEGSNEEVNPLDFLGKRCSVRAAVKIESIFINKKDVKLQLKLHQTVIKPIETGRRRLLDMDDGETSINLDGTNNYLNDNNELDLEIDIPIEDKIELSDNENIEEEKPQIKEDKKKGKKKN